MHYFMIERLMGLFWVSIQQACFVCIKYAHDDIVNGNGRARRIAASQAAVFVLLAVLSFERELGCGFISQKLVTQGMDYYPWAVRITICAAMILFDSLLVLYFWRITKVYRNGIQAARATLPGDIAVTIATLALGACYIVFSMSASEKFGFGIEQYKWIGRFFIQISNFFYIALEVGGAIMFWLFLKKLLLGKNPAQRGPRSV